MDKRSNKEIIKEIEKFLVEVNRSFRIKKAILFGSRARDDWLYTSDIDLIIVSKDFKNVNFLDRIRAISKKWRLELELQPICYTPEEFERKKREIGIINQAVKEGKKLAIV